MPTNVALTGLAKDLAVRAESGKPIRIGLVGAGEMGTDIVSRVAHMQGIEIGVISELRPGAAAKSVDLAYGAGAGRAVEVTSADRANAAMERHQIALTNHVSVLLDAGLVDVVVDATGIPSVGAEIGLSAMERGKHLVMMNVEADVTIGAYLRSEANRLGVVYSLGAGDEPSSCMELVEFVSAMGHRIVSAGKGKNNPLNVDATPDLYEAEARQRNMNPRMLVEFVDGSKTMVEMGALANATGLVPDKPGMHGPSATREELNKVLVPHSAGGVLSGDQGCVDYTIGKGVAPGVFVVAEMDHPRVRERMEDLKMGDGPYFTFFRPYHLTSLEVPLTCARAVLYGKPDMVPLPRPVAEVCAVAKKDLKPGDILDQIGEYTYRAWLMVASHARSQNGIPCGMLAGARVTSPIKKGELITRHNARVAPNSSIAALRERQDAMLGVFAEERA